MANLEMIKFIYNFYEENKVIVLTSIVTSALRAGLDSIILPRFMANVFNSLSVPDKYDEFRQSLIMLIFLWIIMKLIFVTSNYCRKKIEPQITEYIINKLVNAVFEKYEAVNELSDVALLINKIHLIKKNLQELFYLIFTIFIPKLIVMLISIGNIFMLNVTIGSVILSAILVQAFVIYKNYQNCLQTSFDEIEHQDKMYEYMQDIFHNINLVQSTYRGYDIELQEITKLTKNVSLKENISLACVNTQQNQSFFINLIIFIIMLIIIYNLYSSKQIQSSEVVTIILCINGMFENIYDISMFVPELFSRLGVLNSNEEFLQDLMSFMETQEDSNELELNHNFIIFKDVSFAFKQHVILDRYNATIPSNKIVGLFGPSGSGKSTFIKLIFGSVVPTDGEIYIGNIPVIKKNCKSLRKYINYMNQNSHSLFDKTIFENVIYGYPHVTKEQVITLFNKLNLYDIFKNLDIGGEKYSFLDKAAGKLGENLSGGQKAIIHLLHIDFNESSKIIILDEVTASLDNISRNSIIDYIKYLNSKNKTIFIISHDTYLESVCDLRIEFSHDNNPILREK
jgi:ABC-type multidrug transport system fused ATPase/permease subunit